mmetsp:Transcript_26532/g.40157  ORF Transcript_26532/g.40157 Transcript_26532/m.40157 type:complete len:531 (-) Transcript_26532:575-2167(-)
MSDGVAEPPETPNASHNSLSVTDLNNYIEKSDWENVKDCIERNPECAKQNGSLELEGSTSRGFPLHLAVSKKPPTRVILLLLQAYLNAVKIREKTWGRLPIHIACRCQASVDVLKVLIAAHQESLRITDKVWSRLPLHYSCEFASPDEITTVLNAESRALVFKDAEGKTPMDLALSSNHPQKDVIIKDLEERTLKVADAIIQGRQGNAPKPRRKNSTSSVGDYRSRRKSTRDRKSKRLSRKLSRECQNDVRNAKTFDELSLEGSTRRPKRITPKSPQLISTEDSDTNMTPKQSNSLQSRGGSSSSGIESRDFKSSIHLSPISLHYDKQELQFVTPPTVTESISEEKIDNSPGQQGNLAKFLSEYAEEKIRLAKFLHRYAFDSESKDVRSAPTALDYANQVVPRRLVSAESSDDESDDAKNEKADYNLSESETEVIARIDEKVDTLQDIRQNLRFEYENMFEKAAHAERRVEQSKKVISDLQDQISQLQIKLEKESNALVMNETSRQAHMKALVIQEKKINDVNRCIRKHL